MNLDPIIRTVRGLSMSAVREANSGHTSFPLAMAQIGAELYFNDMHYHPDHPDWINRDRLVLSSGHGSMFLYAFLHLTGFAISLDEIKRFRQLDSITPGHPEFGMTPGVECTTGPLGQGIANAVGMAIAEKHLAAVFNTSAQTIFDHTVYCLCGDGDLMEGVAMEATSLAGHLQLDNLITIYDSNRITIDGKTDITYTENVKAKFEALNWFVMTVDGHDMTAFRTVLDTAKKADHPVLIIADTVSGKGAINWEGTHQIHGNPMKEDDYQASLKQLDLDLFEIADGVDALQKVNRKRLDAAYEAWEQAFDAWTSANPGLRSRLDALIHQDTQFAVNAVDAIELSDGAATRALNGQILNALAEHTDALIGGSADLAGSNNTTIKSETFIQPGDFSGRNIHFGVREHAMGAVMNGIAYGKLLRPYGGTFLVFSDYMRPAIRLAALSHLNPVYIFTHDSFYVGEDGPTHHPVEHVASLRLIPNLIVFRPADGAELKSCWKFILTESSRPVALCLTRQGVPTLDRTVYNAAHAGSGAYILKAETAELKLIIITSGSEVSLITEAVSNRSDADHIRIVSMVSEELFDEQPAEYQESVLPSACRNRFAVEAGRTDAWWKYVGLDGYVFGMDRFSKSAPYADLAKDFGFTPDQINAFIDHHSMMS